MFFISDNAGCVHPNIFKALQKANMNYAEPYGNDDITNATIARIQEIFEAPNAAVYFVGTGTAANALALSALVKPWQGIFCHKTSHISVDECGAPEFFSGGSKLVLIDGKEGKICPNTLRQAISEKSSKNIHGVQRGPISLTQITEMGTLYQPSEIEKITEISRKFKVDTHMDGARFANACAALNMSPADITWRVGVDVLSFGGTKNGLLATEAVIFFNPEKAFEFELRRKRAGHLFSKNRFLAAQMLAYLNDGLWLKTARAANDNGCYLFEKLQTLKAVNIAFQTKANMIFASLPRYMHRAAITKGAKYYLMPARDIFEGDGDEMLHARFVCDWSLERSDIDRFLNIIKAA